MTFNGYNDKYFSDGIYGNYNTQIWMPVYDVMAAIGKITNANNALDIGAATGHFTDGGLEAGINVIGVDISEWAVNHPITERLKDKLIVGDITKGLPFEDNSFDLVYSFDLMEHIYIEDMYKTFSEIVRVSNKYIILLISQSFDVLRRDAYTVMKDEIITDPSGHVTVQPPIWWYKFFMDFNDSNCKVKLRMDLECKFRTLISHMYLQNWTFLVVLEKVLEDKSIKLEE